MSLIPQFKTELQYIPTVKACLKLSWVDCRLSPARCPLFFCFCLWRVELSDFLGVCSLSFKLHYKKPDNKEDWTDAVHRNIYIFTMLTIYNANR